MLNDHTIESDVTLGGGVVHIFVIHKKEEKRQQPQVDFDSFIVYHGPRAAFWLTFINFPPKLDERKYLKVYLKILLIMGKVC